MDNTPLRNYLSPWLKRMNYTRLGDLYLPTSISLVNQSSGNNVRLWSTDPIYKDLDLLEVLIASTSLPIAFPPRQVKGLGNTIWIDGGTGVDTLPVQPLILNSNITDLYMICYGSAFTSGGSGLPPYLDDILLLKNSIATINDMRVDLFIGAYQSAINSKIKTYSYIPVLNETVNFLFCKFWLIDFIFFLVFCIGI